MRTFLLLFYSFFTGSFIIAQINDWDWVKSGAGTLDEQAVKVCLDNSGNVIMTGWFSSASCNLGTMSVGNSGSAGTKDLLIVKYSNTGTLQWTRSATGIGDDVPVSIACDAAGNVYVAGYFDSPALVCGSTTLTNASAIGDLFLIKLDSGGLLVWARSYGGSLLEQMGAMAVDNAGNCYLAGSFRSLSVNFGNFGVVNSGNSDAFLAKIDNQGTALWAKQAGGSQNDDGTAVAVDGLGNVFFMGNYSSATLSSYTITNAGASDIFLARYDASNGSLLNSRNIGASQNEMGWQLAANTTGLYVAGSFESNSLNLGSVTLNKISTRDMFILKVNVSLSTAWAFRNDGSLSSYAQNLFIENSGSLLLSGVYDFGSLVLGTNTLNNPSTLNEGFLVRYDASGNILSARNSGSTGGDNFAAAVSDNNGSIFVTGSFNPSLSLGNFSITGTGSNEIFLAKYCAIPAPPQVASTVSICPRQTATLSASVPSGNIVNWYSAATGGSLLLAGNNVFTTNTSGSYFASAISTSAGCTSQSRSSVSLSIQTLPMVSVSGSVATAGPGSSFQWIECKKDSVLTSATNSTFTPPFSGFYAAIVGYKGCVDTTACTFYSVSAGSGTITIPPDTSHVGIVEYWTNEERFDIFPNPSHSFFQVVSNSDKTLVLSDLSGRVIMKIDLNAENSYSQKISDLARGVYFVSDASNRTKKIVVAPD